MNHPPAIDFNEAIAQSLQIREFYHTLEEHHHGSRWSQQEDIIGLMHDVGELGRLVMAHQGRWIDQGHLDHELPEKLAECLWWIFVLSQRVGVDLNAAFTDKLAQLTTQLHESMEQRAPTDASHC